MIYTHLSIFHFVHVSTFKHGNKVRKTLSDEDFGMAKLLRNGHNKASNS